MYEPDRDRGNQAAAGDLPAESGDVDSERAIGIATARSRVVRSLELAPSMTR